MSLPHISIVTPSFNQLPFLKVCVASVEMQGYPKVEQLVVDGGSTDGTKEYLKSHPGHVSWWRSHPDEGQTQALNEGFAKASGEWIGWQNSDDFYYPGVFWRIADISQKHPEVQAVAGDTAIVDERGIKKNLVGIAPIPVKKWLQGYWPYNQSLFIRRGLLEQLLPLDERFHLHMDIELFAKLAMQEPKIAYVNLPLGAFRKYEGIKTDNPKHQEQRQWEQATLRERFQQPMWPGAGWRYQRHRLGFYSSVFHSFGFSAVARRIMNAFERSKQQQVFIR